MDWVAEIDWCGVTAFGVLVGLPALALVVGGVIDTSANLASAFRGKKGPEDD